jgi:hypothetical protein
LGSASKTARWVPRSKQPFVCSVLLRAAPEKLLVNSRHPSSLRLCRYRIMAEIAASSVSVDAREKLDTYRSFGVPECLLWRTEQDTIELLRLEDDEYRPIPADADGIVRSRVFPGLWLDFEAMLNGDRKRVKAVLEMGLGSVEHAGYVG